MSDQPQKSESHSIEVPAGAIFTQEDPSSWRPHETSANRTMQILFSKILVGLSDAFPTPPEFRDGSVAMFGDTYSFRRFTMLPEKTSASLIQLWSFINWIASEAAEVGFKKGSSLIQGLALGELTIDAFDEAVIKQTDRIRRLREEAKEGRQGNRS